MRVITLYLLSLLGGPPTGLLALRAGPADTNRLTEVFGSSPIDRLAPSLANLAQRNKRDVVEVGGDDNNVDSNKIGDSSNITTVFDLQDSHLHLMVHWAGRGSSTVFCLARDQDIDVNTTARFFISSDYGSTFQDVSQRFLLSDGKNSTINKFFFHPNNNCYYVFTDIIKKRIFVTLDCADTVTGYDVPFVPNHVEFDKDVESRFFIHERSSTKLNLFVTENFGQTFRKAGSYVKFFYIYYSKSGTVLYVIRVEPDKRHTVLASTDFFKEAKNTKVVISGVEEFELKEDLLFAVKSISSYNQVPKKHLYVGKHDQRMVIAEFPDANPNFLSYYVAEVTEEGSVMVIASHNTTYSNLYISDVVSESEVKFSLSLERIMYYAHKSTWKNSWIASLLEASSESEATFADFYKIGGLHGIYLASQLAPGVEEKYIRPNNLTTVITFDAGGTWNPIKGPKSDNRGHPILGCYQDSNCSLHIAQQMSRKFPATRTIPILTTQAAPGVVLATGNMGKSLKTKTNVFLSADAGLSWHQVLQGNYYYNIGDHGGVIVAVKYFKTEGYTNELLYSTDEGLHWKTHQFYPTPMRIFGLVTEPGENTTIFTMFGTKGNPGEAVNWIMIKVDLSSVFKKNCTDDDYKDWSPKAPEDGRLTKCVMGRRDVFRRRSPRADCYNGQDLTQSKRVEVCPCTHFDYRCDFGYVRDGSRMNGCVKDPRFADMLHHQEMPDPCPPNTFYNITKGYIKIAGDVCEAGHASRYEPETRACPYDIDGHGTFMLVAQRKKVIKLDMGKENAEVETLPLVGLQNVIAMDFDYEEECVFWADLVLDTVNKQCLGNFSQVEVLIKLGLKSVEGMAFDHISKILYIVDGAKKTIELVKTNAPSEEHSMRKIILSSAQLGQTSKPRGVAVHPKQGYLYYTDWAEKAACVGRALLDGSNHTVILSSLNNNPNNQIQIKWPNGITVDTVAERVYWAEAQLDFIASINLEGGDFKKIVSMSAAVSHPFAVAVFKEKLYWDDWTQRAIYMADKNSGQGIQHVKKDIPGAMDLKIYSPSLLTERNACTGHTCSHLCIARPPGTKPAYSCLCPDGMKAIGSGDQTQCVCPDGQKLLSNGTCLISQDGGHCNATLQFQCANKLCVTKLWKCDGSNDCGDMSDESDCYQETCGETKFQCNNKKCIPRQWRCDMENDCVDNSDEVDCPRLECHPSLQFKCASGECVNKLWRCDLERDCNDGSDEDNCTVDGDNSGEVSGNGTSQAGANSTTGLCDKDKEITCTNTSVLPGNHSGQAGRDSPCLPKSWRCDGDEDCPDGSDEMDCDAQTVCQAWQFHCDNNHCIYATWRCDGQPDCTDGSDEKDCPAVPEGGADDSGQQLPPTPIVPNFPRGDCNEWMFKCESEQCIPYWWKCDGVEDCVGGTDEKGCQYDDNTSGNGGANGSNGPGGGGNKSSGNNSSSGDTRPGVCGFQCYDGTCVHTAWVCDGGQDCKTGEDEDEEMCRDKMRCLHDQFKCADQASTGSGLTGGAPNCVPVSSLCNGTAECADGSDEMNCYAAGDNEDSEGPTPALCGLDEFTCDRGFVCLDWGHKCDGHLDCRDGSDEEQCQYWNTGIAVRLFSLQPPASTAVTSDSVAVRWWLKANVLPTASLLEYKLSYTVASHDHWQNTTDLSNGQDGGEVRSKDDDTNSDNPGWFTRPATGLSAKLTGLKPGIDYKVRLWVRNTSSGALFHHAPVVLASTRDGVPSAPRNLTVEQRGRAVVVKWRPPVQSNGTLLYYKVSVRNRGNVFTSAKIDVRDPMAEGATGFGGLQSGSDYTFQVFAYNHAHESPGSEPLTITLHGEVKTLRVTNTTNTSISVSWEALENAESYYVTAWCQSNQLDRRTMVNITDGTTARLVGLAPGTVYTLTVAGWTQHGLSLTRSTKTSTQGTAWPTPVITSAHLLVASSVSQSNSVNLTWTLNRGGEDYKYGVWYGTSMSELTAAGPRKGIIYSQKHFGQAIVNNLSPCTDYIFAVAVVGVASGETSATEQDLRSSVGRISNKMTVRTHYSTATPPKHVQVLGNQLTWNAPCEMLKLISLKRGVGYQINITNQINGKVEKIVKIGPTRNQSLSYTPSLHAGGRYSLTVQQYRDGRNAAPTTNSAQHKDDETDFGDPSPPVTMYGPAIPPPRAVMADVRNHSVIVYWGKSNDVNGRLDDGQRSYNVVVSPNKNVSRGCDSPCMFCMPALRSPLTIHRSEIISHFDKKEECRHEMDFFVAVSTIIKDTKDKTVYSSEWVRAPYIFIGMAEQHQDEVVIPKSSAVGSVLAVLFIIALLVSTLGYFVFKNRKLRRNIQEFAASHYSRATGATILLDEDDESPIIRGFADNEPLVVT